MAPAKASGQKKAKSANGYRLPDPIPAGEIVTGLTKKKSWRVGKSIGVGGFGEIYLCSEDTSKNVGEDATLAMKIEPHENGPLFVEMNFYLRAASPDKVAEFKKEKGLTSLGMPVHCGSGSHMFKGDRYRFLIMERFGKDLQKIFQTGKKKFPPKAAYTIAIKVIDTLEYIHNQGYCHNDIKAQNLLLGHGRTRENDVYLVDFGLVSKYHRDGVHLEYKPDARKAHDGTIEYTSRDAHIGAHSRRSDLEILGYNLVHWMSGTLPWMDNLTDCKYVHTQKNGFMNDVPIFLQRCFGDNDYPSVLEDFLEYTKGLQFDTEPDYDELRDMFKKALKDQKLTYDGKLDFSSPKKTSTTKKKNRKRKISSEDLVFKDEEPQRKSARQQRNEEKKAAEKRAAEAAAAAKSNSVKSKAGTSSAAGGTPASGSSTAQTPATSEETSTDDIDGCDTDNDESNPYAANAAELTSDMNKWSWEAVLCSDPEALMRHQSRQSEAEEEDALALQHRLLDEERERQSRVNPTPAMLQIIARIEEREKERQAMTWQQQLHHLTNRCKKNSGGGGGGSGRADKPEKPTWDLTPNLLTPAMEEVIKMRSKRVSVEIDVPITPEPSDGESDSEEEEEQEEEEEEDLDEQISGDAVEESEVGSTASAASFRSLSSGRDAGSEEAEGGMLVDDEEDSNTNPFKKGRGGSSRGSPVVDTVKCVRYYSSDSEEEDESIPRTFNLQIKTPQKKTMTEQEREMDDMFDSLLASPSRAPTSPSKAEQESTSSKAMAAPPKSRDRTPPKPKPSRKGSGAKRRADKMVARPDSALGFHGYHSETSSEALTVSVQNSVESPDKIRNKDSPVKAQELLRKNRLDGSETNLKKRLDFETKEDRVSLSDFSMVDFAASSSTNRSPTIPSKSVKSRHVVTKIREKFVTKADLETSPVAGPSGAIHGSTDTSNGLKKSTSSGSLKGSQAKRVSVIPENVFIETARSSVAESSGTETELPQDPAPREPTRKKKRAKKMEDKATSKKGTSKTKGLKGPPLKAVAVKKAQQLKKAVTKASEKVKKALSPIKKSDNNQKFLTQAASSSGKAKAVSNAGATSAPKGKSRRNMRSNSSNARETRAQDWNWADVLLTHPEKKPKKQKAS